MNFLKEIVFAYDPKLQPPAHDVNKMLCGLMQKLQENQKVVTDLAGLPGCTSLPLEGALLLSTHYLWETQGPRVPNLLVTQDVSILIGVEGEFEDAVHHAALNG